MEIANLIVGILSLVVDIIMLFKVNDILKNSVSHTGDKSKNANVNNHGRENDISIKQ